jgi:hypothetical protein
MSKLSLAFLCVVFAAAPARAADPPASQPASQPAAQPAGLDDAFVVVLEKLADLLDANKGDCDKAGDAVAKYAGDNDAAIKTARTAYSKATDDQRKKYKDRMVALNKKARPVIVACKKSDKFMNAMKAFPKMRDLE